MAKKQLKPPYVQVALDIPDWNVQQKVLESLPKSQKLIIEAGTPLIKRYGIDIIGKIKDYFPENLILADLKTLDVGRIEVNFTYEAGAHLAVVSGLASPLSINKFLDECNKLGVNSVIDLMEVEDPLEKLKLLEEIPDMIIFHRAIDTEDGDTDPKKRWKTIPKIKEYYQEKGHEIFVAVAGGINPQTGREAIEIGADVLIVGRYITAADDIKKATLEMIKSLEMK